MGVLDEMKFFQDIEEDLDEVVQHLDIIGSPKSHCNYPWGWAMVGNTPFKRYKQNVHWGGVRAPLVVHWPAQIDDRGAVRTQFHNVIDLVPTVLEVCGVVPPSEVDGVAQMSLHGTSMRYAFASPTARSKRSTQYFEMYGHRAIYHDGWKAVTWHATGTDFDDDQWELYDIGSDFSESNDLASSRPEKLAELIERWWTEAGRYDVLPLDDRLIHTLSRPASRGMAAGRQRYVYLPPISHLPIEACPPHGPRAFSIAAEVVVADGDEGVLVNRGTGNGGYALFVKDGRLHFDYNYFHAHTTVVSRELIPQGRCVLGVAVIPDGTGGRATLSIDGREVGDVGLAQAVTHVVVARYGHRTQHCAGFRRIHSSVRVHGNDFLGHLRGARSPTTHARGDHRRDPRAARPGLGPERPSERGLNEKRASRRWRTAACGARSRPVASGSSRARTRSTRCRCPWPRAPAVA